MIGILKALGANNWSVRRVFLYSAVHLILKGLLWGNCIALGFAFLQKQFSIIKPIMDDISSNIFYAGEIGSGHAIKAGNNLLNLICRMATFEVISMLVKDGVDPEKAVNIIQKSSGRNYATEITLPDNILSGKMFQGFSTGLINLIADFNATSSL